MEHGDAAVVEHGQRLRCRLGAGGGAAAVGEVAGGGVHPWS